MDGEGVGQFVAEKKSMLRTGLQRGEAFHPLDAVAEALALRFAVARVRLYDEVAHGTVANGSEDVLGELAIVRPLFDDREILRLAQRLPFLQGA